ncbi:MAG: PAS domain S-box protein, partial [Bacteroidales bacterium]|nr:PAS domain S-box protein [Bacteroidales bacterium]
MKSDRQKPAIPWILIGLFFVIAVTSVILGILYYRNHKKQLFEDQLNELSVIADLKVRQIVEWRRERLADGSLISTNLPLIRLFSSYFEEQNDITLRSEVIQTLRSLIVNSDYKNVLLIDTASNVLVSFPDRDTLVGDHLRPMLTELAANPEIILTDIHQTSKVSFIHLDLLIPIISRTAVDTSLSGFLAFRIDPTDLLYPSIQTWPLPSKTAESLLIREEGDSVYYFNEPKFRRNTEVVIKASKGAGDLASAMAVRGIESTLDGIDYRGKRVIAAMKKVPESTWHLVAKIDRDEVLAELNDQITLIIIIIILFILTTGLFLGIIEWNESVRFYRSRYEAELDHLALVKHFDYILKYANDIIYLTDRKLNIIEANDRATEACQLSRDDLIGASVTRIVAPGYVESMLGETRMIGEKGFATYETMLLRNDGSVFPVEISAREVEIEGVKYYQSICRDITERKNSEETLRESEERFRKIFEESPFGIAMTSKDLTILRANTALCRMTGYSEEELRSYTFRDFTHPGYIKNDEISLMKLVAEEIPIYHTEKRYIRKDRSIIWGSTTISILRDNNEEVQFFLAMVEDITSRKIAEAELEKSFALISATIESTADGILVIDGNG